MRLSMAVILALLVARPSLGAEPGDLMDPGLLRAVAEDRPAESVRAPAFLELCSAGSDATLIAGCGSEAGDEGGSGARRNDRYSDWLLGDGPTDPYHYDVWVPPLLMGATVAIAQFAVRPPSEARWRGDNTFDDAFRDALVGGSRSSRDDMGLASDVLLGGLGAAVLVDRAVYRKRYPFLRSVASDMTWFLANLTATRVAKVGAGRERPYVEPCEDDPNYVKDCGEGRDANASFFSGHASSSATFAGLLCSRHDGLLSLDGLWCVGGVAASVATGLLRVGSDEHHATDVFAGWLSGATFGYLLPRFAWPRIGHQRVDRVIEGVATHLAAVAPRARPRGFEIGYERTF